MSNSVRSEIIGFFTRTMFIQAYASFVERLHEDDESTDDLPEPGSGEDWANYAPETSRQCEVECEAFIAEIEAKCGDLDALWIKAGKACNGGPVPGKPWRKCRGNHTVESFGHYLAMQYVGHGVCWNDDHIMDLDLPHSEGFMIFSRSDAGLGEVGSEGGDDYEDPVCDCGEPEDAHKR